MKSPAESTSEPRTSSTLKDVETQARDPTTGDDGFRIKTIQSRLIVQFADTDAHFQQDATEW